MNRNDLCWCGSGLKYKKCHLAFDEKLDGMKFDFSKDRFDHLIRLSKMLQILKVSARLVLLTTQPLTWLAVWCGRVLIPNPLIQQSGNLLKATVLFQPV